MVKVRKILVNASISALYYTILANIIYNIHYIIIYYTRYIIHNINTIVCTLFVWYAYVFRYQRPLDTVTNTIKIYIFCNFIIVTCGSPFSLSPALLAFCYFHYHSYILVCTFIHWSLINFTYQLISPFSANVSKQIHDNRKWQ